MYRLNDFLFRICNIWEWLCDEWMCRWMCCAQKWLCLEHLTQSIYFETHIFHRVSLKPVNETESLHSLFHKWIEFVTLFIYDDQFITRQTWSLPVSVNDSSSPNQRSQMVIGFHIKFLPLFPRIVTNYSFVSFWEESNHTNCE